MGQSLVARNTVTKHSIKKGNEGQDMQDFLIYFSPANSGAKLLEAIHALYYLPQNFKLVLTSEADVQNDEVKSWAMQNIMNRIRFGTKEGMSDNEETSSFCYAEAIDSDNPEAFASAVLRIARAHNA